MNLRTDMLLLALRDWASKFLRAPTVAGLAHVSRNVYFGPAVRLGPLQLAPAQTLVAALFSHGEIGLEALTPTVDVEVPTDGETAVLSELGTFSSLRCICRDQVRPRSDPVLFRQDALASQPRKPESFPRIRRREAMSLAVHPLVTELWNVPAVAPPGDCLRHAGFVHHDIEGDTLDEIQVSLARGAAARAYSPPMELDGSSCAASGVGLAGCAIRSDGGALFAGSAIGTRSGAGALSPMQVALMSMLANGARLDRVVGAVWMAPGDDVYGAIAASDEALLRQVAPDATFVTETSA